MFKLHLKKLAIGAMLAGASTISFATTCDSALASYETYASMNDTYWMNYIKTNHPECFAGSGSTSNVQINATAFTQAVSISRVIASRLSPLSGGPIASSAQTGLAAGGKSQAWNVWANVDQNDTDFEYMTGATRVQGGSEVQTSVLGADYALAPNMVVGVSMAFDNGDGWGRNGVAARNTTSTDGFLIAPYLGYQISKDLSVDVSAGLGEGDFSGAGGVSASADRWFAAANLSYARWMGNWQVTGKASYLHGEEEYGNTRTGATVRAGTASTNKLDQIRLGAQAGLWMDGFMPYAGLGYTSNINTTGNDPLGGDAFVATLGVNFFSLSSKVSGGVFFEQELNRDHSDNQVISANINFRF
ncbi:MAG: hypothetical protein AB1642_01255 [Pseudomonadota bacterium]